ncbi:MULTISPECIES: response regulator transcription factor [unclassified Flavobacterium]|uniref:response regulator transcription factor n=1 Tax=unclassified Flavobacterium TaxID=196869 RepID=UPI0012909419|nr:MULTISPECIES: response regulator transcription factor [unclassified Flavobacterium]MQP52405.1 response regulator [Flavobacterium sp. LMO9]MQP62475.1 response regulator [Flavobacterium sp. LMO6]
MFKKVLIAEDFDSINIALIQTLESIGVQEIHHAKYCDDALLKLKKALHDNEPYDLLISDLSFETDYRTVIIASGEELIAATRKLMPELSILVYTVEDKPFVIKTLVEDLKINAFVHKGRNSISQLKTAMETILFNGKFISQNVVHLINDSTLNDLGDYDVIVLQELANGVSIDEMEQLLKLKNITPNSKSYIEKRISKLKDIFKAKTTIQLIAITKDLGVI